MNKRILAGILTAGILAGMFAGCVKKPVETQPNFTLPPVTQQTTEQTTEPAVPATIPADGNPGDVTCKGSYTGQPDSVTPAARIGDTVLTNDQLSAYYWAEVAQYCQSGEETMPDLSRPLDTQVCEIDGTVATWQQFFLRRALNTWHSAQALMLQGDAEGLPVEEAYQPNLDNYEEYMTGMPATKYLYRYQKAFQPNTLHQAYLDAIPETLEALAGEKGYAGAEAMARESFGTSMEALEAVVESYNRGYMYFTNLTYYIEPEETEEEEQAPAQERLVDLRHMLLIPQGDDVSVASDGRVSCTQEQWTACLERAEALLADWAKASNKPTEATFAAMARKYSQDAGTTLDGGAYHGIRQGQLMEEMDAWCFSDDRAEGDTVIFRSDYGVHVLYYGGSQSIAQAETEQAAMEAEQADILTLARGVYPMEVDYSAITLSEGTGSVSLSDILYPDIGHERFPEVPLYLQQDYPKTMYGGYPIRTNGCGITTMAMAATYFADDELTPPEMCARYGKYSFVSGTDGAIFQNEPPVLGFYLREKTYEPTVAKAALEEGQIVVCLQNKGYWTRGGHYIVLEKLLEDGRIQVRDSNIYNYGRISSHKDDCHTWGSITSSSSGFWIFEDKVVTIPACSRCGSGEARTRDFLREDYTCHKCDTALLRRNTYLAECGD